MTQPNTGNNHSSTMNNDYYKGLDPVSTKSNQNSKITIGTRSASLQPTMEDQNQLSISNRLMPKSLKPLNMASEEIPSERKVLLTKILPLGKKSDYLVELSKTSK
jgi:hypothetical protein